MLKWLMQVVDASGDTTVVLWETDVDELEEGISYQLNKFMIRSFKGKNHLFNAAKWSTYSYH